MATSIVLVVVAVMVVGVIGVLFVAVIFVFVVSGELFLSGFFRELHAVQRVAVGQISVVASGRDIVLVVSFRCEEVMLCGEFEVMSGFAMSVERFFEKFVLTDTFPVPLAKVSVPLFETVPSEPAAVVNRSLVKRAVPLEAIVNPLAPYNSVPTVKEPAPTFNVPL